MYWNEPALLAIASSVAVSCIVQTVLAVGVAHVLCARSRRGAEMTTPCKRPPPAKEVEEIVEYEKVPVKGGGYKRRRNGAKRWE